MSFRRIHALACLATSWVAPVAVAAEGVPAVSAFPDSTSTQKDKRIKGELQDLSIHPAALELQYESLDLTLNGKPDPMGFITAYYNIKYGGWYWGFGFHAAIRGEHGGLNGIGLDGGYELKLFPVFGVRWGLGVAGVGGVGTKQVGEGLMIRSTALGQIHLGNFTVGAGVSYVDFPSGTVRSTQAVVNAAIETDFLEPSGPVHLADVPDKGLQYNYHRFRLGPIFQYYATQPGLRRTPKETGPLLDPMRLMGARADYFLTDSWFGEAGLAASIRKQTKGFLNFWLGGGYQFRYSRLLAFEPNLSFGAAGGGTVPTGGGMIVYPSMRAVIPYDRLTAIQLGVGYVRAISPAQQNLRATVYDVGVAINFDALQTRSRVRETTHTAVLAHYDKEIKWRFRGANVHYFLAGPRAEAGGANENVELISLGIDYLPLDWLYLTGQASWPYAGKAAGYASGQIGIGHEEYLSKNFGLDFSIRGGPSAGGTLPNGDGVLFQYGVGGIFYPTRPDRDLSFALNLDKMSFLNGPSAWSAALGARYGFKLPVR